MDVDRLIRWGALLAIPAIVVGLYYARSEPADVPETSPSAAASSDPLGLPPAGGSKLADDITRRGEAALGAHPGAVAPDQQKKRQPRRRSRSTSPGTCPCAAPTIHAPSRPSARGSRDAPASAAAWRCAPSLPPATPSGPSRPWRRRPRTGELEAAGRCHRQMARGRHRVGPRVAAIGRGPLRGDAERRRTRGSGAGQEAEAEGLRGAGGGPGGRALARAGRDRELHRT